MKKQQAIKLKIEDIPDLDKIFEKATEILVEESGGRIFRLPKEKGSVIFIWERVSDGNEEIEWRFIANFFKLVAREQLKSKETANLGSPLQEICYYEPDLSNSKKVCAAIGLASLHLFDRIMWQFRRTSPESVEKAMEYLFGEVIDFAKKIGDEKSVEIASRHMEISRKYLLLPR